MAKDNNGKWFEKVFLKTWRPYVWIVVIGFLLYLKTLSFGFVDYDDKHLIINNHKFLSDLSNIFQTFRQDVFHVPFHRSSKSYYRPLLTISLMVDQQLGGISPFVYHFTNIIIHLMASCLFYSLLIKLKHKNDLALFFSLVFTVHPVLTQAVAWIPGRNDSLLAVFILLGFISFLNLWEKYKWKYYFFHMLFFSMALFTKETALALIFICFLYLQFAKKEKLFFSHKISIAIGWFLIICFWFLLRVSAIENPKITIFHIVKSILLNSPGFIQYAGKILFPLNLSVYPIMKDMTFFYGIITVILLIIAVLVSKNKRIEFVILGSSWFILFLLPSLISAKPGLYARLFEHRIYLSIIGFIVILVETDLVAKLNYREKNSIVLSAVVISIFSLMTFYHSNNMRNAISFWENAATKSPHSPEAHLNLGDKYYSQRLISKAEGEFRKALELDSQQIMAHNNLGRIYANKQMFKEAEEEFTAELVINPDYDNAIYNLGMVNYEQGKIKEAIHLWIKALKINPYHIRANRHLAAYYYKKGDFIRANYHVKQLQKRGISINIIEKSP